MKTCPTQFRSFRLTAVGLAASILLPAFGKDEKPSAVSTVVPIPVARDGSDLEADPAVTWGVLDNGLRYAIMPNPEPPNRVSLRLYVDAGSLMEEEDQRGLAHFLEHMAFNGTENFPAGEMVEYFQRLGMGFGNHTNAHTSFNETVYKLEMPNTESETLAEGFRLLNDYADGMLLPAEEIESERGIILSEKRNRDSAGWRTFVAEFEASLPDALVSKRLPIGTEEVIKNAKRERFESFYKKWYTPDRMAVVVVGDIEVAAIEPMIKEYFGPIAAPPVDVPDPELGKVSARGLTSHFHSEMDAGEVSVSIEGQREPFSKQPVDNAAQRAYRLRMGLASQVVNRRLGIIAKAEESKIKSGRMYYSNLYDLNISRYSSIMATCKPEDWQAALEVIEQELRRAIQYGFTDAELAEAKANVLNSYEKAAQAMATRKSSDLANEIARRIGSREVFTSPADDLVRVKAELEKITAEQCQSRLAEFWKNIPDTMVMVSGNLELKDSDKAILAAYQASSAMQVEPPAEVEAVAFAYGDVADGGEVAKRTEIEDLKVTQAVLSNGVRVNLRPTDFEDDTIYVKVRFGSGKLVEPADKPGLAMFTDSTFVDGGLEAHDIDTIKRIFAGKAAGVGFSVEDDAFVLSGKTRPSDLHDQLLMLRAYLVAPGYRTEAQVQLRGYLDQYYQQLKVTPDGVFDDKVESYIHGGDRRFGIPPRDELESRTMEESKAWLAEALAGSYMEVTAVGDFDLEEMLSEITGVFGGLPERAAEKSRHEDLRKIAFPQGPAEQRYSFESKIPKAGVRVYWPTEDIWDIKRTRRLSLLASILDDRLRLKLREELGDVYSPFAHNAPSDAFTGFGYTFAGDTVAPEQADKVVAVIRDISDDLAAGEITADEMERALKPRMTSIEEYRRTNGYWMGSVVDTSQEYPQRLDWARSFISDHEAMTLDELKALAKQYLGSDKAVTIVVAPSAAPADEVEKSAE